MITKAKRDELQREIIKYDGFPDEINACDITQCQFIREIPEIDIYTSGINICACRNFLIALQISDTSVLPLLLNLYGYYTEHHIAIRAFDKQKAYYPLYVNCSPLN